MITPSFALTATERVLPRLALDFTTAVLDPRVTVSRALNTATVTNANGSIGIVNANLPRFDYANGICKGLLIEETRANLLINSIWSGAVTGTPGTPPTSWTNTQTTGSISAIAPATYAAGNAITLTCAAQRRVIFQRPSVAANTSYTASFDIITTTADVQIFSVVDFRGMPAGAAITGYTLNGATAAGNTAIPIGTHKITITAAIAATAGTLDVFVGLGVQSNITSSVTISNIQLEAGAFATSYIPTTTTSLTRNADAVSMTGTNFSSWFNATRGAFIASFDVLRPSGFSCIYSANVGGTGYTESILQSAFSSTVDSYIYAGGVQQTRLLSGVISANTLAKTGMSYAAANFAIATDGTGLQTQLSGSLPVGMNRLQIGATPNIDNFLNGHIVKLFWYANMTNAELVAFTK